MLSAILTIEEILQRDVRVLLIADDPLARAGLASLVTNHPGFEIVGRVSSDGNLDADLDLYRADVVLWDLGWEPSISRNPGSDVPPLQHVATAGLPLVVLIPDSEYAAEVRANGVRAILLREANGDQIAAALLASIEGLVILDPAISERIAPGIPVPENEPVEALTHREMEVLRLLAEGYSNKAIALALSISEHTIKFHVNSLMSKLNAQSRTEVVVKATRLGLITL